MSNTHGPIEESQRKLMQTIAAILDEVFNSKYEKKEIAFVLLTARFGDIKEGRVNYISNAQREDMLALMHEFLGRAEGRYSEESRVKQ